MTRYNPSRIDPNVEQLIAQSQRLRGQLGNWLLEFGQSNRTVLCKSPAKYLIASVDYQNDLYYSPVTNIAQTDLFKWLHCTNSLELIDELRDRFPVRFNRDGVLNKIIEGHLCRPTELVIIHFDQNGAGIARVRVWSPKKMIWKDIMSRGEVSPRVKSAIADGRKVLDVSAVALILQRREVKRAKSDVQPGRSASVVQVGMAFAPLAKDVEESVTDLALAANICAFASHAVLTERERYYERAIRQCRQGEMLKSGPHRQIDGQVRKLDKLKRQGRWALPVVNSPRDQDLVQPPTHIGVGPQLSWYFMSRFGLPSLKQLLTSVRGFATYEVRAITRCTIIHLSKTFWENLAATRTRNNAVCLPLYLASVKAADFGKHLQNCYKKVQQVEPLKTEHDITLHTQSALGDLYPLAGACIRWKALKVTFNPANPSNVFATILPPTRIGILLRQMAKHRARTQVVTVHHDTMIHGDAHFENILVDASIPEDPVVVSIDTPELIVQDVLKGGEKEDYNNLVRVPGSKVKEEVSWLLQDRTYDYAKLLMSSWLLYSVVGSDGFAISPQPPGWCITLREDKIPQERQANGASGAGVTKVMTFPPELITYHNRATELIVQTFLDELPARCAKISDHCKKLMVVRLWALTIRHGLSLCKSMFPAKASRAFAQYMITASLFHKGKKYVDKVLANRSKETPDDLIRHLFKPRFEELGPESVRPRTGTEKTG